MNYDVDKITNEMELTNHIWCWRQSWYYKQTKTTLAERMIQSQIINYMVPVEIKKLLSIENCRHNGDGIKLPDCRVASVESLTFAIKMFTNKKFTSTTTMAFFHWLKP